MQFNAPQIPFIRSTVKTSTRGHLFFGLMVFAALFAGGGAWAYYAELSGAIIAPGQVAVLGKPKTVQHLDGGIVAEILVTDGHTVTAGETMIALDETLLRANLNIYQNRLIEALMQRARLITERDASDQIEWDVTLLRTLNIAISPQARIGQQKLFDARMETRKGQVSQLREKIAQLRNQINGIKALKASKMLQIDMMDEELVGIRALKKRQLIAKSRVMLLAREKVSLTGQTAEHDAEIARIQNSVGETEIQILQIGREFRQSVLSELRQVEREINEMTQQLYATMEQLRRTKITAPVSGIVHQLSVYTLGGVLAPGAAVAQIIPQDDELIIAANIAPQFIDEVHNGQSAKLRFSAFNQRTTPEISGQVRTVSANVVVDENTGNSYYEVLLSVSKAELAKLKAQKLVPGMPVEAFIMTRNRSALNYLTKPLTDQIMRAFRED